MHVTDETCRICLGKHRLKPIFRKNLPKKIMYCAAVEISEEDELPKMICNQCMFYLDVAYIFRTVCEATDARLHKHFDEKKLIKDIPNTTSPKQNSEDARKQQNSEDLFFINSPIANEVVIGDEEIDEEVEIILSACEESSSSTEVEIKTPPTTEVYVNERTPDDNKENKEKIGRHTARKISAKVAKRVSTLGETFNSVESPRVQIGTVPENSNTTLEQTETEISRRQPPSEENWNKSNTSAISKTHQCSHCSKAFPYKSYLKRHMTVHVKNKKYKCSYCDKKFINRNNLNVHMQTHSGNFPYKCKVCDRGFAWPSLLKRHLNSHTSNAEFQCQYCSKKMLHLSSLKLHEKMHLYRPSYTCDVCFKTFAYTNSLATHKKVHKGVKDIVCGICKKQFTRKTSLRRHVLIHFRNKNFNFKVQLKPKILPKDKIKKRLKCDVCSRKFGSKVTLLKHAKQHNCSN